LNRDLTTLVADYGEDDKTTETPVDDAAIEKLKREIDGYTKNI
jgi:hypothetical protein